VDIDRITRRQIREGLERILPRVAKPGRYAGGELNSVVKDWDSVQVHLALAFPDIYDLGMSNLGLMVLYDLVNKRPDMLAERVFSPWIDMEDALRSAGLPLYTLESKRPVASFDVLGITLPYQQLYSNALNLLDLSGIPLLASERGGDQALVIAGGHATFNPEPMSRFMDAFVIGDGEEVLIELLTVVGDGKRRGIGRTALLRRLATVPGVYVPVLYDVTYHTNGSVAAVEPRLPEVPGQVRKRIVPVLAPPPTRPVVPFVRTVHDRAVIEIMRGCTRGCRFCHAGFVTRPVRERPVAEVLAAVDELVANTGYGEIGLLSLSSSDYTQLSELVSGIEARHANMPLGISLPSLRIETASATMLQATGKRRRGSATFAPEAATDTLRRIINKMIPEKQILEVTNEVFGRGWRTIKLYFMIGHPRETLDDVKGIADLAWTVLRQGRKHHGRRARVNLGVSTFIPQPHTPFQWLAMDPREPTEAKLALLKKMTGGRGVELKWNEPGETMLEGLLSRGDRRLGAVIQRAWELGARFDGWREHFDLGVWKQAVAEARLTFAFYTHRQRPVEEVLPWDHIDTGVRKSFLIQEYERSLREETQPDCREGCVACGILTAFSEYREALPAGAWQCPEPIDREGG
jgi:radical SAM family uncharacterized protein